MSNGIEQFIEEISTNDELKHAIGSVMNMAHQKNEAIDAKASEPVASTDTQTSTDDTAPAPEAETVGEDPKLNLLKEVLIPAAQEKGFEFDAGDLVNFITKNSGMLEGELGDTIKHVLGGDVMEKFEGIMGFLNHFHKA